MKTQYRAEYRRNGQITRTRYYNDKLAAQDALMKRVGDFHYLGLIAGDGFSRGECNDAPRNGGLVSISTRP
jgi:hypothetical protein